jgi:hypothetical protein
LQSCWLPSFCCQRSWMGGVQSSRWLREFVRMAAFGCCGDGWWKSNAFGVGWCVMRRCSSINILPIKCNNQPGCFLTK